MPKTPKPRTPRSSKKTRSSNAFINDEAEESDDGALVEFPVPLVPLPGQEEEDAEEGDDRYETEFINNGDPYDGASDGSGRITPPPPGQRIRKDTQKGALTSPTKGALNRASQDAVIDVADTSDEDMEAMDPDDRKTPGVKPSALPPSLTTRSAAKRSARTSQDSAEEPAPSKRAKTVVKSDVHADTSMSGADLKQFMGDFMASFMKDHLQSAPPVSESTVAKKDVTKRLDFDKIELKKGLAASAAAAAASAAGSSSKRPAKQSSPDWDSPFEGDVPASVTSLDRTSTVAKGKNKAESKSEGSASRVSKKAPSLSAVVTAASKAAVKAIPLNIGKGSNMTLAQLMGSDGVEDADPNSSPVGVEDDDSDDGQPALFMEDLETYRTHYDPKVPCGVSDVDLQDTVLSTSYEGLPSLPSGREIVPVYDPTRASMEHGVPGVKGGRVKFTFWATHIKRMLVSNSYGAVVLQRCAPNYVNLSRVSPAVLSRQSVPGSSATQRIHVDNRVAICVSALFCTESKLVSPAKIGGKSERLRKWVSGIFHNQEWERFESLACLVFGERILRAQLTSKKALAFQTMMSPDSVTADNNEESLFDKSAPADMFSPIVSSSSPPKSRSSPTKYIPSHAKTLLNYNDFVPVYDARKKAVNFEVDLPNLSKLLPLFPGEIPFGSFIVVGYTCTSYMASLSGSNERVAHLGCNVLWVVVCGTPPLTRV
ncbi:hypothetical protein DFH06DRAFT_1324037 [Mycena polygramma]|nr:hypothetical protein DFH06DRAFT_1324037 [Mycena polygramma]